MSALSSPAHFCASQVLTNNRRTNPKALQFLYDNVPESFKVHDSNNRTPEDVTILEKNDAQLLFTKIEAKENEALAVRNQEQFEKAANRTQKLLEKAIQCEDRLLLVKQQIVKTLILSLKSELTHQIASRNHRLGL